jgi:hypothetical protein
MPIEGGSMPWHTPITWVVDQLVSEDDLNTQLRDNLIHLYEGQTAFALVQDRKPAGMHGGTFTAGAWRTRDLNTIAHQTGAWLTLSANRITLAAGTYHVHALVPAYSVSYHQARLFNTSDGLIALHGTSGVAAQGYFGFDHSVITGRLTLAEPAGFEIQHRSSHSFADQGFGAAAGDALEVYTSLAIWRISP